VDSEEHLSYNGFWEALSNILEELGSDETEDQINCDIGGGPGHGLVVIFGACYGMAPICNHIQAPKYLGSVVGFTGAPNLSTVETVFSGYALHEKEGFDFVKQVFYDKNKQEGGFDVIAASLNAVTAISDQLEPSAPNPHGRYGDMTPDPDEGKLVEYFPESGRVRRLPLGRTKDAALKQFREETK
jgi:hypothetical protein